MIIRKFKEKDGEQVLKLVSKVLYEIFKIKPRKIELDKGFFKKEGVLYVAEEGNRIIASVGLKKHKNKVARLKKMYIEKQYRNAGLAQKLYNKVESFAKKVGYNRIILSTTPQMKAAIKFYQKNGFVQYRFSKDKNQVFFVKDLN